MNKMILLFLFYLLTFSNTYAQNLNLDEYEVYIGDTLISKSDFIKNGQNLDSTQLKRLEFKPISDGFKTAYNLNGRIYSKGKIENQKETGFWEYWHSNGNKAREGEFINGKPNGTHKYWYENGNLRGIGNWKIGVYDGVWEMYSEDGIKKIIQNYKDGKIIEK